MSRTFTHRPYKFVPERGRMDWPRIVRHARHDARVAIVHADFDSLPTIATGRNSAKWLAD
jgi:hypothetical protein